LKSRGLEVVQNLRTMFVRQQFDGLEFDDDLAVAGDVGNVDVPKPLTPIIEMDFHLRIIRNALVAKLDFKAFLIDWFHKSMPFVLINIQACSDGKIRLFFEN